jgi:hypothetical protein
MPLGIIALVAILATLTTVVVIQVGSSDTVTVAETTNEEPATVEHIEGTELSRVTLSQRASERLGIETVQVVDEQVDGAARKTIPYGSVIYDATGGTWTYTNPEPLVFVRHAITIDRIEGDQVVLSDGPPSGTNVVKVGAALLFGAEYGVGH